MKWRMGRDKGEAIEVLGSKMKKAFALRHLRNPESEGLMGVLWVPHCPCPSLALGYALQAKREEERILSIENNVCKEPEMWKPGSVEQKT